MAFAGFSEEGLALLAALPSRDREWFAAHKAQYQATVADPAKGFVVALGERLDDGVSPLIVAEPKTNGSISPINNDLRFDPDRSPYKDHLLLRFWEGGDKKIAPTLFVRLTADETGFATGMAFDKSALDRWRGAVDDDGTGPQLVAAIDGLGDDRDIEVVGAELKRVPKPYDAEHPRGDLLRHKWLQVRWLRPNPPSVNDPAFVDWCGDELERAAPIHRWLVENVA